MFFSPKKFALKHQIGVHAAFRHTHWRSGALLRLEIKMSYRADEQSIKAVMQQKCHLETH